MPTNDDDTREDYTVGNKRPPKHSQFAPGKSGNPAGRPKGSIGVKAKLAKELRKIITVKKNGKSIKMMKEDVILEQLIDNSMRGDLKSAALVLKMNEDFNNQAQTATAAEHFTMPGKEALKRISERLLRHVGEDL